MRCNISLDFNKTPLLSMDFKDEITIDIKDTSFYDLIEIDRNTENNTSRFWDMIHNARDFAEILKNNKLTIILSIK
ncbi:MAG: hypothetical protein ABJB76_00015 [Candidatus Nitrosocosmicus sp.]